MGKKEKVAYYFTEDYGGIYYAPNHPMKPVRLCMTHELIMGYGLHTQMQIHRPRPAVDDELLQFHDDEYVDFLQKITPNNKEQYAEQLKEYNMGEDCPVFSGLYDFCKLYTGASLDGARRLSQGQCSIAINWAGGLHHAKKKEASGFCYVNDLVLSILELLKTFPRVLYIDIDIHHGDGVEEAFYLTDRVMTVSFHRYGEQFFPGTGAIQDVGEKNGRYYTVNVPLRIGVDDDTFHELFKPIMTKVMEMYRPGAIVMQCGADSLMGDRLGCFNMTTRGHAEAVRYMKSFNVPMIVTGGGGYTKHNVARCWTLETAVLLGEEQNLSSQLPDTNYNDYFKGSLTLDIPRQGPERFKNQNTREDIHSIRMETIENLRGLQHAPGVAFDVQPPSQYVTEYSFDDPDAMEERMMKYARDHAAFRDTEYITYQREKD